MSIQFCICPQNTVLLCSLCSKFLLQWLFFPLQYIYETNENGDKVVLGKGTYGVVYAGRDLSNQVRIAIKEIPEKDSTYGGTINLIFFRLFFFIIIQNCSVVLLNAELQFLTRMWFSMHALMGKDLAEMLLLLIPRALQRPHCVYSSFSGL